MLFSSMATAKFQIKKNVSGQYYFVLKAPNGETIATSESYTTKQACKLGIEAVRKYAPIAKEEDLT
jgi:uncharacterized protein YegP (UPF0339 family)